jgi:hypothetical protein
VTTSRGRHARHVSTGNEGGRRDALATAGLLAAVCAGIAAVAIGATGAANVGGPPQHAMAGKPQPAARLPSAIPSARPDWPALLQALDAQRSAAFASGDALRLGRVDAPASPALTRDQALLSQLVASGWTAGGVRLRPSSVRLTGQAGDRADLAVLDSLLPYWLVAPDGTVASMRPGRGPRRWSVTLVRVGASWRVFDVRRA